MAFDAFRGSDPDGERPELRPDLPVDYVDWAMRIIVFGPLLALYVYWIGKLAGAIFNALTPA